MVGAAGDDRSEGCMRVSVDLARCQGNGACQRAAPEVFEVRDGSLHVLDEHPDDSRRKRVRAAARACPTQAIKVEDA